MDSSQLKKWLDMAVLDLQESKKNGAAAIEQASMLLEENEILKKKLNVQKELWDLERKKLEEAIEASKKDHASNFVSQSYEIARLKVSLSSERQDSLCFKLRLDGAMDEVDVLFSRLESLGSQLKDKEVQIYNVHQKKHELELAADQLKKLKSEKRVISELKRKHAREVEALKNEHSNLTQKRKQEVSALIREKNFVWEQLKRMEDDYENRVRTKKEELKAAEEDIQKLRLKVDELQKAHDDKTVETTILRVNMQSAEEELQRLREELLQIKQIKNQEADLQNKSLEALQKTLDPEDEPSRKRQELMAPTETEAASLLAQKEEELKKAKKLMDELRLENANLRMLYADLEGQFKDRQKPEKGNRDSGKDATTRNLNAELEAVATTNESSPKAKRSKPLRNITNLQQCKDGEDAATAMVKPPNNARSQRPRNFSEKATEMKKKNSSSMSLSEVKSRTQAELAEGDMKLVPYSEMKQTSNQKEHITPMNTEVHDNLKSQATETSMQVDSNTQVHEQSTDSNLSSANTSRHGKNRLFSSAFGIPKVVAGT